MTALTILAVTLAGLAGGLGNAYFSDGGFVAPHTTTLNNGKKMWDPGWLGSCAVGALAALVVWGLNGPFAGQPLFGGATSGPEIPIFSLGDLAAALVTGIGGSRVLNLEVDQRYSTSANETLGAALLEVSKQASHGQGA